MGSTSKSPINYNSLFDSYQKGYSMMDISKKLNCSVHKVVYWMDKYNIRRRNPSDASYARQNPEGDPFKIKTSLNAEEKLLYGLGIGIYWGEGTKTTPYSLVVGNTDPNMLRVYRNFLIKICQVKPEKIKYGIITFNDANPEDSRRYWSEQLQVSPEKFGKITQIPPQGKGSYHKKSKFGVCAIRFSNIKLKAWIMNEIASLK